MDYSTILLKQNKSLFHTPDLALLWEISNKNTLYTTIKRYVKKGILHRIHKGFYSTKPIQDIDPVELGIAYIHAYAYLSTEYVLSKAGIINQLSPAITLISTKSTNFNLAERKYIVRKMKSELLYNDTGIQVSDNGYKVASPERAVEDMTYYNKHFHFDNRDRFDINEVNKMRKQLNLI